MKKTSKIKILFFSIFFLIFLSGSVFFLFFYEGKIFLPKAVFQLDSAMVYSEEEGFIRKLPFKEGDIVKKEELLFKIEDSFFKLEKLQKEKQVKKQKIALQNKQIQIDSLTQEYITLRSEFEQKLIDKKQLKNQFTALSEAKKSYEILTENLEITQTELEALDVKIKRKTAFSPIDGMIAEKKKCIGEPVKKNELIYVISDNASPRMDLEIPSKFSKYFYIGKKLNVKIQGKDRRVKATVSTIQILDPKKLKIKISLDPEFSQILQFFPGKILNAYLVDKENLILKL